MRQPQWYKAEQTDEGVTFHPRQEVSSDDYSPEAADFLQPAYDDAYSPNEAVHSKVPRRELFLPADESPSHAITWLGNAVFRNGHGYAVVDADKSSTSDPATDLALYRLQDRKEKSILGFAFIVEDHGSDLNEAQHGRIERLSLEVRQLAIPAINLVVLQEAEASGQYRARTVDMRPGRDEGRGLGIMIAERHLYVPGGYEPPMPFITQD
jgi:hypothetical protein